MWEDIWIGLNDLDSEGTYVFSDGTPMSEHWYISNWAEGEPNNNNNEDCVVFATSVSSY